MTNRQPEFFFDTADLEAIRETWKRLESDLPRTSILGVTTNPNALDGVKANVSLAVMEERVLSLAQLTTEIRGGGGGVVNVQVPSSRMSAKEMQGWVDYAKDLGDDQTKIAIKLTPDRKGLLVARTNRNVLTNITGVADSGTAINCFEFSPTYVSLIYGRIRDAEGDPEGEFGWTEKYRQEWGIRTRIIGGSLRDKETVQKSIEYNAIPTIGIKAWNKMFNEEGVTPAEFVGFWNGKPVVLPTEAPRQTARQKLLSGEFFAQMDTLGQPLYDQFKSRLV